MISCSNKNFQRIRDKNNNFNGIWVRGYYLIKKSFKNQKVCPQVFIIKHIIIGIYYVLLWNIKHWNCNGLVVRLSHFISKIMCSNPNNYILLIFLIEIVNMCIRSFRKVPRDTVPLIGTLLIYLYKFNNYCLVMKNWCYDVINEKYLQLIRYYYILFWNTK